MGVSTFAMLLSEKFYGDSRGGLLEATGKLYANDVKLYVQPMSCRDFRKHLESVELDPDWVVMNGESEIVSILNLTFKGTERFLQQYLIESGWVENLVSESAVATPWY